MAIGKFAWIIQYRNSSIFPRFGELPKPEPERHITPSRRLWKAQRGPDFDLELGRSLTTEPIERLSRRIVGNYRQLREGGSAWGSLKPRMRVATTFITSWRRDTRPWAMKTWGRISNRFGERAASCAWIRYELGQDTQDGFALDRLNRKMDRLNAKIDKSRNECGKN